MLHLVRVVDEETDVQRLVGVDRQDGAFLFALRHIGELFVVLVVAVLQTGVEVVLPVEQDLRDAERFLHRFHIALRLGQDDDISVIPLRLEEPEGQGVGTAAVHIFPAVQFYRSRRDRQRGGGPEPFHVLGVSGLQLVVDRLRGLQVGRDDPELHRVFPEGLEVEDVVLDGHDMVAEVRVVEVPGRQEGREAAVPRVSGIPLVVADDAARLFGLVVASEGGAGRDADGTVEFDIVFQKNIHDAGGKEAAHGPAFQNESGLHALHLQEILVGIKGVEEHGEVLLRRREERLKFVVLLIVDV